MRRSLFALSLAVLALGAAACGGIGGGDEEAASDAVAPPQPVAAEPVGAEGAAPGGAAAVLLAANQKALEAGSARMAMNLSFASGELPGELPGELKIAAEGVFDMKAQKGDLALDLSSLSSLLGAQGAGMAGFLPDRIVMDGLDVYIRMPGLPKLMPQAKKWLVVNMAELGQQTGQDLGQLTTLGQADPTQLLKLLQAIDGNVEEVGQEKVRDVATTHYRVAIDLQKMAAVLPAEQRAGFQQQLDQMAAQLGLQSLPFDVWIGDDGLLRRMSMALDLSAPAAADGATGPLSLSFVVDMYDYGVVVDVQPPAKGKTMPLSELTGMQFGA